MGGGFSGPSLAVFTALAPAGAVAFFCVAAFLFARRNLEQGLRDRLSHLLCIPLAVVWVGFIASATHLGTPANALHVVSGIGRSPLSNEVAAAALFLFFSGVYWMYTYKASYARTFANVLLAAAAVMSVALVAFTSVAYSIATVPSWNTWLTPVNLWLSALTAGPALAAFVLHIARCDARLWPYALLTIALAALAAGSCFLLAHAQFLEGVTNNVTTAAALVPGYGASIALHACIGAAGLGFQVFGMRMRTSFWRGAVFSAIGCAFVFAAVLLTRLPFYEAYISVGF